MVPTVVPKKSREVDVFFFSDVKVAVGQANGRISLLSFYAGGAAIKEFGPKSGRACNDLAWNPKFTNYLAAAYGKNNFKIEINFANQ